MGITRRSRKFSRKFVEKFSFARLHLGSVLASSAVDEVVHYHLCLDFKSQLDHHPVDSYRHFLLISVTSFSVSSCLGNIRSFVRRSRNFREIFAFVFKIFAIFSSRGLDPHQKSNPGRRDLLTDKF